MILLECQDIGHRQWGSSAAICFCTRNRHSEWVGVRTHCQTSCHSHCLRKRGEVHRRLGGLADLLERVCHHADNLVISFAVGGRRMCLPMGFSPGKYWRASWLLTMTLLAMASRSCDVKKRPVRRGIPSALKYPGSAIR